MSEVGLHKTDLDTPFLWTDLDKLESNIAEVAGYLKANGVQWRPHFKGVKTPAIAHMALRAGAIGLTCAKLGEVEVMAACGVRDFLVASQVVGRQKYTRLARLSRTVDVKTAVDSTATLDDLNSAAREAGVEIGLLIEVNTGMNRAGVEPGEPVVALAQAIGKYANLRLRGLMTWEGHTLTIADPTEKRQAVVDAISLLRESAEVCRAAGIPIDIVSCGGSGTYAITAQEEGITEIQAGGAIFNDITYTSMNVPTQQALFVHSVVTSRPAPDRIIMDSGWKTLPGWNRPAKPIGIAGVADIRMSAEHGTITLEEPNDVIAVGDRFDFVVGYGDQTVFLHDVIYALRGDVVEAVWPVAARGKLR